MNTLILMKLIQKELKVPKPQISVVDRLGNFPKFWHLKRYACSWSLLATQIFESVLTIIKSSIQIRRILSSSKTEILTPCWVNTSTKQISCNSIYFEWIHITILAQTECLSYALPSAVATINTVKSPPLSLHLFTFLPEGL